MADVDDLMDPPAKRIVRRKKTVNPVIAATVTEIPKKVKDNSLDNILDNLSNLANSIDLAKNELESLKKTITETREGWEKEAVLHEQVITQRNTDKEVARKRENEEYTYQQKMERKRAEDEFAEKRTKWEKELTERKEEIAADKKELTELRGRVAFFDTELARAVKEAQTALTKDLTNIFNTERKLREQEIKSEKEILAMKIASLSADNNRLTAEAGGLKRALDEANREVKEIAVKVIEGRSGNMNEKSINKSE